MKQIDMRLKSIRQSIIMLGISLTMVSCNNQVTITSGDLEIGFDKNMQSKVHSLKPGTDRFSEDGNVTEYLETLQFRTGAFKLESVKTNGIDDSFGKGEEYILQGQYKNNGASISKIVTVKTYQNFPDVAIFNIRYVNTGEADLLVESWMNHHYGIQPGSETPEFWSFQGKSSSARGDWVLPVTPGFYQENFMGMNQSDYGGGIPVTDLWRRDGGIAVGHMELVPREVSLPVHYDSFKALAYVGVSKKYDDPMQFNIGDTLKTVETFVTVHKGDYYASLEKYSTLMQAKGITFAESEEQAFESIWCGWGYERKFTVDDIISTLPKVKELGIKWAVIDDGFQIAEGDWRVDTRRFPGGSADMKKMVDAIHDHGLKAKLWWAPLAADPGSKVIEENPDILLINEDGAPQYITWWDSYYMSPASEATFEHTRETVKMFMDDWGFDGLKLDGQHMNAVPEDHNWKRDIEYPGKSIEMLPEFFKMIYEEAREIKPHAVVENCPCGTCMSFYNMPYTNQTVSSDPTSSWQIRLKGKTYKAIIPHIAYYGDHVELSDNGTDFASSFGIGAVLGTKFTWPEDNPNQSQSYLLTPEKEKEWKKWFNLYHEKMLSKEEYRGDLYDIGFDKPETHVISDSETMYYAFYSKAWDGEIELRGLDATREYIAYDYVNETELERFNGDDPKMNVAFNDYLLISVYPIDKEVVK